MSKRNSRTVYRRPDGKWVNQLNGAFRASSVGVTQQEVIAAAKRMLANSGGGELTVKGVNGRIRSKDTIPPANDPNPPKDTEH